MPKPINIMGIVVFFIFVLFSLSFAVDETMTITTYYPSPYGSYNQIKITGGSPGTGKILVSDSAGSASWQTSYSIPTTFGFTGADQSFVVPTGVSYIKAELWGASGAGGTPGGWSYGAAGGGGGYTRGIIPVTPGETLTVKVGERGAVNQSLGYGYGGGASGTNNNSDNRYGSGGGGMSAIFRSTTPLLIAGGGGGGGSSRAWTDNIGGSGGGLSGAGGQSPYDAKFSYGGGGGTQTAGGTATGGQSGTQYQGGHAGTNSYGGGGGGGYWGGAGGGYSEGNTMGGGGGGSGYIGSTVTYGVTMGGSVGGGVSSQGSYGVVIIYY